MSVASYGQSGLPRAGSFQDLEVYKRARELAGSVFDFIKFPNVERYFQSVRTWLQAALQVDVESLADRWNAQTALDGIRFLPVCRYVPNGLEVPFYGSRQIQELWRLTEQPATMMTPH